MANAERAWELAERRCFEWLIQLLESEEGKDAFIAELPDGAYNAWSFAIEGPGDIAIPMNRGAGVACAHEMDAVFSGLFAERSDGQLIGGKIMDGIGDIGATTLDGIVLFSFRSEPSLAAELVTVNNESAKMWRLEYDLTVVFSNSIT